jgi:hypothetical protein
MAGNTSHASSEYELRTLGHATLVILEDGQPLIATDPWLLGSNYWRSWWLEKYPRDEDVELVKRALRVYVTHSHPDHFHWPTLRRLGPRSTLHATFPRNPLPGFLREHGFSPEELEPWRWYTLACRVRIASVPVPIDDSILVIDTPPATVVNLNDTVPRTALLRYLRATLLTPGKPLVVLRSYSPASVANSVFVNGERVKLKAKADYVAGARRACETLGATHFVPFASQVFFARTDSRWANEFRVTHEDLEAHWGGGPVVLCRPFARMDLGTRESTSGYDDVQRVLDPERAAIVAKRESEEAAFTPPADLADRLKRYLDGIALLPLLFRRGIGWRLATSGRELFYSTRGRAVSRAIPRDHDFVITLPDKVLDEALTNGVLSDLGITMFVRVDTKVRPRLAYSAFLLMGLRDYGYFDGVRSFARFIRFYVPYLFPALWRVSPTALLGRQRRSRALDPSHDRRASHPAAEPSRTG